MSYVPLKRPAGMTRGLLSIPLFFIVSAAPGDATGPGVASVPSSLNRFEYFRVQMGTRVRIVLYAAGEDEARRAAAAAFEKIAELDQILTDYNPESELMRLCREGHDGPVRVSSALIDVLQRALEYSVLTDGAFDPTVGPLVSLWRSSRRSGKLPEDEALRRARALVGYRHLRLDLERETVRLRRPGMKLDLGGIAKGFAVDRALEVLAGLGIESALVDAGGDIGVSGAPPGRTGWLIEIQDPSGPDGHLTLSHCAVATSGNTEQYVELDGKRYSHIVDPKTGMGVLHSAAVTVIAPDCASADALATALSVLPPEEGLRIAESQSGVAARITVLAEKGYRSYVSQRMADTVQLTHSKK